MSNINSLKDLNKSYQDSHLEFLLEKFANKVFSESDFTEVDRIINFINTSSSTGKNNIIYKLSKAFNNVKYNNIPLLRLVFIEAYKLMSNDAYNIEVNDSLSTYVNDLYFQLMKYNGNNERIKELRYYLLMVNIIWLIDFKGSNIYFLVQRYEHDEFYNQLLFHLINKFNEKLFDSEYLGFSPRIIYAAYIYGDILEYKFKNYNTIINNSVIYKILHKVYINNKGASNEIFKELLIEEVFKHKHISKEYKTEVFIDKLVEILNNPYSSEVDVLGITGYGEEDESGFSISEEKLNSYHTKQENIDGSIEDIITLMGGDKKDPNLFILYDVLFNKIDTIVLHQLKEFENCYNTLSNVLDYLFDKLSNDDKIRNKILINNLNFVEQATLVEQRQTNYSEEYKTLRNSF